MGQPNNLHPPLGNPSCPYDDTASALGWWEANGCKAVARPFAPRYLAVSPLPSASWTGGGPQVPEVYVFTKGAMHMTNSYMCATLR